MSADRVRLEEAWTECLGLGEAVSAAAPASGCVGMASFLVGMRMTGVWGLNKSGSSWTAGAVCLART